MRLRTPAARATALYQQGRQLQRLIAQRGGPPAHLRGRYERAVAALDDYDCRGRELGFAPLLWALAAAVAALSGVLVYAAVRVEPQIEETSRKLLETVEGVARWTLYGTAAMIALGIYQRITKGKRGAGPRKAETIERTFA